MYPALQDWHYLRGAPKPQASKRTRPEAEAHLQEVFPNGPAWQVGCLGSRGFQDTRPSSRVLVAKGRSNPGGPRWEGSLRALSDRDALGPFCAHFSGPAPLSSCVGGSGGVGETQDKEVPWGLGKVCNGSLAGEFSPCSWE